jgi:inorganic pyrophosphatase
MTFLLHQLPARQPDSGLFNVIVDTPKGSRNKYKYDEKQGLWRLSKVLPLGASFPFDFGFIPSTRGEDGDPLDALVLVLSMSPPFRAVSSRLG